MVFNNSAYLQNKAAALAAAGIKDAAGNAYTEASVGDYFTNVAGITPEQHFEKWGRVLPLGLL